MVLAPDRGSDGAGWDNPGLAGMLPQQIPILHSPEGTKTTGKSLYTANMSSGVSVDEFQALEQKVLRAVEIVKREREARAVAEAEVAALRDELAAQAQAAENRVQAVLRDKAVAESKIAALNEDREAVRLRVEKMLHQMDELL